MNTRRAYSLLHVKAVDDGERIITGIATTPTPDRSGDIVEPLGVTFKNPLPLLLGHDASKPVGHVTFGKPTKAGIPFSAKIPTLDTPGVLKDRLDEAYQSVKLGLIAGVSIGFRVLNDAMEFMKGGGILFAETEVMELSLVAIPANAEATILTVKSLAASGRAPSGVPDHRTTSARKDAHTMTVSEQISAFTNTRTTKAAAIAAIMAGAASTGETLDAAQKAEYDTLTTEIANLDDHLERLKNYEKTIGASAAPAAAAAGLTAAAAKPTIPVISVKANVPKGTGFIRIVKCLASADGNKMLALEYAKQYRDQTPEVEAYFKAAVAAGTSLDATWAGPLAPAMPIAEFLELLRPATLIGKIAGLRRVPFNVSVPNQTGGGTYAWAGQGSPAKVSALAFATVSLAIAKATGIIVITQELARISTPSAEDTVKADMLAGMQQYLDAQFVTPAVGAVANVSPASITNGITPITSAGTSADNARTDIKAIIAALVTANIRMSDVCLLMSESNAFALSAALNPLGQQLYPQLTAQGGNILGFPVYTSNGCGNNVIGVDARSILLADENGLEIEVSREASVQMDSAPDDPAVATTVHRSLWAEGLIGLKATRFINWKRARTAGVQCTVQAYV